MRLDPLSIPYRTVQGGLQLVVGVVVFGIAGAGSIGGPEGIAVFGLGLVALVAVSLAWQVAYYRRFEYLLTEDTFDIRSGVLSRREREIPYRRIQNVDIRQNVVQRVLGIAEVSIETAGGGDTEASLRYVEREEADRLQNEIRQRKREGTDATEESTAAEDDRTAPLFELTPNELLVLGVVSLDPKLLSLLAVPLSFIGPSVIATWLPEREVLWVVVVVGLLVVLAGTAVVSGLVAVTRYYGFRLVDLGDEYRYERGLLQRFSGSIPKDKIQTVTLRENVLARRLGYASLTIETAGSVVTGGDSSAGSQSAVPIAERERVVDLARRIEPIESLEFERPPRRARERYAARYGIVVLVLASVAYAGTVVIGVDAPWYAVLALLVAVPPAAHLKWTNRGYRVEDDHVITRNGFWSRGIVVVPAYRIQTVASAQTVFQRRRDLATVLVDTAGGSRLTGDDARAVDIDATVAEELRERLAEDLQRALGTARCRRRGASGSNRESPAFRGKTA